MCKFISTLLLIKVEFTMFIFKANLEEIVYLLTKLFLFFLMHWTTSCLFFFVLIFNFCVFSLPAGSKLGNLHGRFQSSYVGTFARRVRDTDVSNDVTLLKELYRSDPERVIRLFESQPSLHSNPSALAEYVKALVKVDRLEQSTLLKTLQRGKRIFVPD